jgi:hypothetical protein
LVNLKCLYLSHNKIIYTPNTKLFKISNGYINI